MELMEAAGLLRDVPEWLPSSGMTETKDSTVLAFLL